MRTTTTCAAGLHALRRLDIRTDNIGSIVWATGHGLDFSWIDIRFSNQAASRSTARSSQSYRASISWGCFASSEFVVPVGVADGAARLADHLSRAEPRSLNL